MIMIMINYLQYIINHLYINEKIILEIIQLIVIELNINIEIKIVLF